MKKKYILVFVLIILIISILLPVFFIFNKDEPIKDPQNSTVSSYTSSEIKIEEIESTESKTESEKPSEEKKMEFISPDETEADRILEEKKKQYTSAESKETKTFEEGKKELEKTASNYLKEHNIDVKTAGETGEKCVHCGSKLWDPDKYGLNIPGMPEDYENSGYCLGTCAISLE